MPQSLSIEGGLNPRPEGIPAPAASPADVHVVRTIRIVPAPPAVTTDAVAPALPNTANDARGVAPATTAAVPLPRPAPSPVERAWQALPIAPAKANVRAVHENTEAWLAAWNILGSAHKKIDATYYILSRDVFGYAYLGMLLRKRHEGVPVKLNLDATGDTLGIFGFTQAFHGEGYLQELVSAGAEVNIYNPYSKKIFDQLLHPGSALIMAGNHDKILATERYAMTGGRNISSEYFSSPDDLPTRFRDSDVVVEGARAVRQLDGAIHAEMDRDDLNDRLRPSIFHGIVQHEAELLGTAAMMDAWLNRKPLSDATKRALRTDPDLRARYAEPLVNAALADLKRRHIDPSWTDVDSLRTHALELTKNPSLAGTNRSFRLSDDMLQVDTKALDRTSLASGPQGHDQIDPGLERLIKGAQRTLLITNPYIVLTERMQRRLSEAARRGVKIVILTDSPTTTDDPVPQGFFLRQWPKLLQRIPNMRILVLDGDQRLHAKTVIADDEVSLVGSYNFDWISSHVNGEILETVSSREFAAKMEDKFAADITAPRNRVREYTIARTPQGKPLLRNGEPIVTFGPANHIKPETLRQYKFWMPFTEMLEKLPQLAPLRRDE